jgi:hypothetical protein
VARRSGQTLLEIALPPIGVRVAPTPIFELLLSSKSSIFPISAFTPLFHQPVAISAIFAFIPFVPIAMRAIVVPVVLLGKTHHRDQKRTTQDQNAYQPFHRTVNLSLSVANQ